MAIRFPFPLRRAANMATRLRPDRRWSSGKRCQFTYVVTNQGTVDLGNVSLTDSQSGLTITQILNGNGDSKLQPGETWVYTATATATGTGPQSNTGTVTAKTLPLPGAAVSDSDQAFWTVDGLKFFVVDDSADDSFTYSGGGVSLGTSALAAGNTDPRGVAANAAGTRLWVVDKDKYVYVYNTQTNSLVTSWKAKKPDGADISDKVQGIATDGTNIWLVDDDKNLVLYYANGANFTSATAHQSDIHV